ncbi:pilus assembly protein TadG [Arthrobacter pityocampae]|uniref:Pilus assembly protein TadG n=1 Tax=Arthrobacter pityocampae TaxID=547334 RepID=A0A2S5IXM4_9MICC|nr:Tad domain-containing protein [Arthrobacter pityocampae]PPB49294.1 pilus assembly protein TadG [Arthrobacter pityocampae]
MKQDIARQRRDERGAISVIVALTMVVLLGFAAVAIDVGMVYAERAQLQNGADAASIATAQECALMATDVDCTGIPVIARSLVNSNALDDRSNIKDFVINRSTRKVTVITGALKNGQAPNHVSLIFAKTFGITSTEVNASSTAEWGSPVSGPAPFPITFSECELKDGPGWQVVEYRKKSDGTPACAGGPPGGFGSLDHVSGKCEAIIDISKAASGSNTGNNGAPLYCTSLLTEWRTKIEAGTPPIGLFPIYDKVTDSGSNGVYHLIGFAAFEVHGWKLKQEGSSGFPDSFRDNYYPGYKCSSVKCVGIIGRFVKMVSLDDAYTLGAFNPTMGTAVVRLTLEKATP